MAINVGNPFPTATQMKFIFLLKVFLSLTVCSIATNRYSNPLYESHPSEIKIIVTFSVIIYPYIYDYT